MFKLDLQNDGFGEEQYFKCIVAEKFQDSSEEVKVVVGYAVFYNIYSTWEGKSLKLEEHFVLSQYEKTNAEKALLITLAKVRDIIINNNLFTFV